MGLLAAAVSALAGAGATTWWEEVPDDGEIAAVAEGEEVDEDERPDRLWLGRSAPPEIDVVHPLAALDDSELELLAMNDPAALGSISLGSPSRGALLNSVAFPESELWILADPEHAWGTLESVQFVQHAIRRVNEQFENTPVLYVGDFSAKRGGRLKPHKSHQSGRDVDIGYYYLNDSVWYRRANAGNLDRARSWALLSTLLKETRVEYVFIDKYIQPLLVEYALAQGEDPEWLARVFNGSGRKDSVIRHRAGHATHIHVRFENPTAELTARRSLEWLQKAGLVGGRRPVQRRGRPSARR
jgi:murein endopeptidase